MGKYKRHSHPNFHAARGLHFQPFTALWWQAELHKAQDKVASCVASLRETQEQLDHTSKGLAAAKAERDRLEKTLAQQWDSLQAKIDQVGERVWR